MEHISSIEHNGVEYTFEPPVPHEGRQFTRLAELTAVALVGDSELEVDEGLILATEQIQMFVDAFGDDPQRLARTLTGLLGSKEYIVRAVEN